MSGTASTKAQGAISDCMVAPPRLSGASHPVSISLCDQAMSQLGQTEKQMFSALLLLLRADIAQCSRHVRFMPGRDSCTAANGNDSRPIVAPTKSTEKRACKGYAAALARSFGSMFADLRHGTEKLSCARARYRRRTQRGTSDRNRADRFRQWRDCFSRRPDDPSASI